MTNISALQAVPVPGDNICVSVQQFAEAMGHAQGQILLSAGEAMIAFFLIGVVTGAAFVYVLYNCKVRIDRVESERDALLEEDE